MSARVQVWMWTAQRASAAVLAIAVTVHLATVIYAVRGDLTAAEIIARVQGNVAWLIFYVIFVLAAATHAPIGIRTILLESTPLAPRIADALSAAVLLIILILGLRTAFGLYALQT
ncbi:MAG: succinate dehydrogenase [Gammaproteobacteria bacterium]|nr:succinate dehydrogenase [Gammaproteobacteria bacterium]